MTDYIRQLREIVGSGELLQLPSVSVALRDDAGRVLMVRHREGDAWLLPGGSIEPGETPADAALREMWEETGLLVRLTRVVGVFGGRDFIVQYANGDRTSYVSTTFEAVANSGVLRADASEILELRFMSEADTRGVRMAAWAPEVLQAVFCSGGRCAFRQPTWSPTERQTRGRGRGRGPRE